MVEHIVPVLFIGAVDEEWEIFFGACQDLCQLAGVFVVGSEVELSIEPDCEVVLGHVPAVPPGDDQAGVGVDLGNQTGWAGASVQSAPFNFRKSSGHFSGEGGISCEGKIYWGDCPGRAEVESAGVDHFYKKLDQFGSVFFVSHAEGGSVVRHFRVTP